MRETVYVNLFLMRENDGKILVPVRAEKKTPFAGCFDFSVGGHCEESETASRAMRREMLEELNLKTKIKCIDKSTKSTLFFGVLKKPINWFETSEIKELHYKTTDEIKNLLKESPNKFKSDYKAAFNKLLVFLDLV